MLDLLSEGDADDLVPVHRDEFDPFVRSESVVPQ
jgi:hypothetical protein